MKSGIVALIGRPNVGKSTLVNAILRQKVSITSPKPQTTRFPIQAFYEDERGQIVFIDTPGIFAKAPDQLSSKINKRTTEAIAVSADLVLYFIDHTRKRDFEEAIKYFDKSFGRQNDFSTLKNDRTFTLWKI